MNTTLPRTVLAAAALLALTLPLTAQNAKDAKEPAPGTKAEAKAPAKAAAPAAVPTLEERLNQLRTTTDTNIVVLWGAIESAGIRRDQPVALGVKRVSAAQLLKLTLEVASAGQEPDNRLGYVVEDGMVWISTRKELKNRAVSRLYDVQDLAMPIPNFTNAPTLGLRAIGGGQ